MIVRILGEGQYAIADSDRGVLDDLDASLLAAVEAGDEPAFTRALAALTTEVRRAGQAVADDAFAPSDLVVPFADATLEETRSLLAEPGVEPGKDDR